MKKISILLCTCVLFFFCALQSNAAYEETYAHYHIIDIDHPLSFEEIKKRYEAYDYVDGNITESIQFESEYEQDYLLQKIKVFDYSLQVTSLNSRGKQRIWKDVISVRDFTAPILNFNTSELSIDLSTENLQQKIIEALSIEDNWDKEGFLYSFYGIEETKAGSGTYTLGISVEDQSKNRSTIKYINVSITESIQKFISKKPILVEKSNLNETALIQEFLKNTIISFPYKTIIVKSNYLEATQKQGIYQAQFEFYNEDELICIYQCKIINQFETKKKKDKTIYLSLSIMGILFIIGMIIYRKRR